MRIAPIDDVRARIASLILGDRDVGRISIGSVELKPFQRSAVVRLRESIHEFGGAVLCDPVGTGKTFISLAVPTAGDRLIVVAPAVLRDMWSRALAMADRSADFVSFESLSRGSHPESRYDFVIVDEAHHTRNPKTVRYRVLAKLVSQSDVLLLTATPIHNRRSDLVSLISLFLGERAATLTPSELTRCVIRRDELRSSIDGMPEADSLTWMRLREDHRIPELLLSLPPPLPPRDGGDGGVLITRSLIRQWSSSDAALMGGLKRRIVRAEALISALSDNTWPTRSELLSWISGDDAVQLGLPGILAAESSDIREMLVVVQRHLAGLKEILEAVRTSLADMQRVSIIRQIRDAHIDRKIVAFSEYADTITGLFRKLMNDGRVCMLTGSGARVAGGSISRTDAIWNFAPAANGQRKPSEAGAITLLLTTDLLSEGVNLQDAGVVIHLDLPWTPARMEQRLGRVARVGSRHEHVMSYAFRPPASAETVVRIERILREKVDAAGIIMPGTLLLPGSSDEQQTRTEPQRSEAIRSLLSDWYHFTVTDSNPHVIGGVSSNKEGFLAAADIGGTIRLIACADGIISESAESVLEVLQRCCGTEVTLTSSAIRSCERAAISWLEADLALPSSPSGQQVKSSVRANVTRRINRILRDARTHERSRLAAKAERAIAGMDRNLGAYSETELRDMSEAIPDGSCLIDRVIALTGDGERRTRSNPEILAMIVLVRK
jgi:hypothetical protein